MSSASNNESYSSMRWVFKNAQNGFYLFTATPSMQRRVAEHFGAYDTAVYDYGKNNAPYSFADLAKWTMQQKAKIFFIINMQIALREENDMINLNLSRDLLTKTDTIWVFSMTPDTDNRFVKIAIDFYSFIRLQVHFEDEDNEIEKMKPIIDDITSDKYYDSYDEAKEQMNRYDSLCKKLLALPMNAEPERLLSAAMTLKNIADLYFNYSDYEYAMKLYMHIKEIREKVLGKEHPDTATTYNKIAGVYDRQGDYSKALEWFQKALAIRENVLGMEHPNTATMYNNIAGVYDRLGDYPKALEWYQKALAINEKVLGKEHPDTATTCNNIAGVYYRQGDYPKALEWYQKALDIREKVLGKEHPDTSQSYNNIAAVYDSQGDYPKALEWYQKALDIYEKVLSKEHPSTATTYNNIALVYYHQGDYLTALEWYFRSYQVLSHALGESHPLVISVKDNMKTAYLNTGASESFEEWLADK